MDIKYPVEFYHYGFDWQLRDGTKRTLLRINIEGMDFEKQKLAEKVMGNITRLMNLDGQLSAIAPIDPVETPKPVEPPPIVEDAPKQAIVESNGHKKKKRGNPWGRKGKPK